MRVSEPIVRKDSRLFEELCAALLRRGHAVQFRANGQSMTPNLLDGDDVVVAPANAADLRRGDVVLAQNADGLRVHRLHSFDSSSGLAELRSDTALDFDPPASRVFGKVVASQRGSRQQGFTEFQTRFVHPLHTASRRVRAAAKLRLHRLALLLTGIISCSLACATFLAPAVHAQTADLQLTQTASATAIAAGSTYTDTEVVKNNASSATVTSATINVYMQTPPNSTYQSYTGTNWSCTSPGANGIGPIVCTYNTTLASGATASSLTITFKVAQWAASTAYAVGTRIVDSNGNIEQVVTAGTSGTAHPTWSTTVGAQTTDNTVVWQNAGVAAGTTIQSSATVTNSSFKDTVPSNNTSLTSIIIEPTTTSDLALSMSVAPTPIFIFSNFTYTITIQNLGQATAPVTSNVLTDTLPTGLTNVSVAASAGWSCSGRATVTCSITTAMALGSSATITITATAPSTAQTLSNTATVSLSGDPNSANNSATTYTVVQPLVCATPGKDGAGGALSGIVNAYYPPSSSGTLAAASTSVALGAASGASDAIAAGDLLLIIQMQGASINSSNTSSYGHGVPGDPAAGSTALNSSGLFEFITATNAVPVTGGTLTFTGTGPTGGLLNSYSYAVASASQGQETYQVIRVPQYTSATLSSTLTALAWNGSLGGVLAIDVSSQLTLSGTVALDSLGFRGGGGITLAGTTGEASTDYVTDSPATLPALSATQKDPPAGSGANGSKGEGIAGTPHWIAPALSTITTSSTAISTGQTVVEGFPNGSFARGAPGNAGGGGTDGDPAGNDYNSGGGAGGNGGAGGQGGYGWNSMASTNSTDGGFGGVPFPANTNALVMGGGGGAGTSNNGSYYISSTSSAADCGTTCTGIYSSGGTGGGIVIIHAGSVTGTGTITSNGQSTLSTLNDSTGGAGAGGSVLVFANSGGLSGLTVNANGGSGGDAWQIEAPGGFPGQRHGPGGGGGGGVIFLTSTPAGASVAGGSNGYTDTVQDSYGSTPGQAGTILTTNIITETPGTQSGAYCAGADLAVTNSGSPAIVQPGGNITYTQTVTNNGPFDAVNVVFSEGIPANTIFESIVPAAGWSCTYPAVGGTGNITCTDPDLADNGTASFTVVVEVGNGTATGTQIVDVDTVTSGTNDPNLANNTATVITSVGLSTEADLAVTNTASAPTVLAGSNVTMTAVVTNYGPATATGVVFSETIPTNTTLAAGFAPPTGWSCYTAAGTLYCSISSLTLNATATFPVVLTVNAATTSGTVITDTATIASPTPDPNTTNNVATATTIVGTAGQADLEVTASGTPNPVTPTNNITYTQSVTNNGPAAITISGSTTVTFTDTIPANTTLASAFTPPAGWTCNTIAVGGTGTFTCTLNSGQTFGIGTIFNFPLVVKVSAGTAAGTIITNSPTISSSVTDPNTSNNTATVNTTVASPTQADVSINKTASPNPVNEGTNLTYTLTVTNSGPAIAQNVVVTDPIPAQVTYSSAETTVGSCTYSASSTTVTCNIASLPVGSTAVITINVTAMTFSSSTYSTNTATVSASTSDPDLSNNTSSFTTTIQSSTAVDISAFNAYSQPDGSIRLVWHTQEESRNLGFHIYREDGSGRHRVDPALIAGSALLLRGSKPQHAAKTYAAIDSQPSPTAAYWLEDVDLNGARTLHGPVYAEPSSTDQPQSLGLAQNGAPIPVSQSLAKLYSSASHATGAVRIFRKPSRPPVVPADPTIPLFNAADHTGVKISVSQEGWYHIPFSQLFSAGLSPDTDVQSLHLYAEGVEQPILLVGRTSGLPSASDAIEFYGTGIDTPFSADRVYWLVPETSYGKRVLPASEPHSGTPAPNSFPFTVTREDRTVYIAALLNGENNDNFFGAVVSSEPVDQTLDITHLDTTSTQPLTLTLNIQGATDAQEHSIAVQLNGSNVGTMNFYGQILATQSFSVDPSTVLDGTNTITLTALNGDNDVSAVQSIQLEYMHTYTADSDWLQATAPAGSDVNISGFANPQVRVFDITNPLSISELTGKISLESGSYTINVALPTSLPEQRTLLAFSSDTLSAPAAIASHAPTLLDQIHKGADDVIIAYPDFATHLAPLVRLRESQGHTVELVTIDQVFDEYNFGERSPFAVRTFLQGAVQNWQRKPQSVLFVGDASMDPRNYLGFGDFDFVPTRIIETAALKTASDDWFSDFLQNGYATTPTGRLPARTTTDVDLMVSKIIAYEQGSDAGAWNSQALLIADQNVDSNFTSAVTSAAAALPSSLQISQILANGADPGTVHSQIVSALNNGALLVDYNGHGAEQQWSFVDLFDNNDATALTNGGRLPVYLLIDCLNGLFQDVYAQALAKALILAPNGGAVAVWASSGFTDEPPQASMDLALLQQLATNPDAPLGLMILRAKSGTLDNDVRRTWILFGDPAMKFHFAPSASSSSVSSSRPASVPKLPDRCPVTSACPKENR
ncbi:MAG: C25 family cysteine peptidase [Candidatus Acidiferrum sp.]